MTKLRIARRFSFAVACIAIGCTEPDVVGTTVSDAPGLIIFHSDTTPIVAPDTVTRGQVFAIQFHTFAGGCTRSIARTTVTTTGQTTVIRPYDRSNGRTSCTRDLLYLSHSVQLRIDEPGPVVLRIIGEQSGTTDGATTQPAEVTRTVVVR